MVTRVHFKKSQSAMEYLMTYGWAILIIAVVLGVLFQLGVFSGITTPKAQAGNCQIIKVGSGITQTISLAGECQGQEPQFVASFSDNSVETTLSPKINMPQITYGGNQQITIAGWLNDADPGGNCGYGFGYPGTCSNFGCYSGISMFMYNRGNWQ